MKIVGGSFGVSGSAHLKDSDMLVIDGATRAEISQSEILSAVASVDKEGKFSAISFLMGVIVFGVLLWYFFGAPGFLVALVLSIAGSYHSKKTNTVEVRLSGDRFVTVVGSKRAVDKLVRFATN